MLPRTTSVRSLCTYSLYISGVRYPHTNSLHRGNGRVLIIWPNWQLPGPYPAVLLNARKGGRLGIPVLGLGEQPLVFCSLQFPQLLRQALGRQLGVDPRRAGAL